MKLNKVDICKEIKKRLTVIDYASNILGLPVRKDGDRTTSLIGGNNKTATVFHNRTFRDFKSGQHGSVIDLCALVKHEGDVGAAILDLANLLDIDMEEDTEDFKKWKIYTADLTTRIKKWNEALRPADINYLHSRRISDKYIEKILIGYNGRLVIPYWKNGYPVYYTSRICDYAGAISGDSPKYMKAKLDGMNQNIIWGLHTLHRFYKPLVIAEGCFDAMSFDLEGYRVLSGLGGDFSQEQFPEILEICRDNAPVFIVFDWDSAGMKFSKKWAKIFFKNEILFFILPRFKAEGILQQLKLKQEEGLKKEWGNKTEPEEAAKEEVKESAKAALDKPSRKRSKKKSESAAKGEQTRKPIEKADNGTAS